jgi:hypothetical protein
VGYQTTLKEDELVLQSGSLSVHKLKATLLVYSEKLTLKYLKEQATDVIKQVKEKWDFRSYDIPTTEQLMSAM